MYFAVCSLSGHIMLLLLPQDFIVFSIGNRKMVPGLMRQTNKMMFHQSVNSVQQPKRFNVEVKFSLATAREMLNIWLPFSNAKNVIWTYFLNIKYPICIFLVQSNFQLRGTVWLLSYFDHFLPSTGELQKWKVAIICI